MGCTTSRPCSAPNKYQTQIDDHTGTSAATAWESPPRPKPKNPSDSHPTHAEPTATNEATTISSDPELQESRDPSQRISAKVHRPTLWQPDTTQAAEPLENSFGSMESSSSPRHSRRRQSHRSTRRRKSPMSSSTTRDHSKNGHREADSLSPASAPSPPLSRSDSRASLDVSGSDKEMGNSSKSHHSHKSNRSSSGRRRSDQKKTNLDHQLRQKHESSLPRQTSDRSCSSKRSSTSSSQNHTPVASKKKDHSSKRKSTRGKRLPENEHRIRPSVQDSSTVESTPPSSTPNTPPCHSKGETVQANSSVTNQCAEEPSSLHTIGIHRISHPSTSLHGPSQHSSSIGGPSLHSNNSLNNYLPQHMKAHKNSPQRMIPAAEDCISLPSLVSFSSADPDNTSKIPEVEEEREDSVKPSARPSLRDLVQKLTPSSIRNLEFEALDSFSSEDTKPHHPTIDLPQPEEVAPKYSEKEEDANKLEGADESEQSIDMQTMESDDESDTIRVFKFDASDPTIQQFHPLESKRVTPHSTNSMTEVDRIHLRRSLRGKRSSKRASNNRPDHLHSSLSQVDAWKAVEAYTKREAPSTRRRKAHKGKEETVSPRRRHTIEQGGHHQTTLPSNRTRRPARNTTGDLDGLLPSPPQRRSSPRPKRRTTPTLTADLDAADK
jgi:hypothetical protein